jgi:hypothetical protein
MQMERMRVSKLQLLMTFCLPLVYLSCTMSNERAEQQKDSSSFVSFNSIQNTDTLPKLTTNQQDAFDALNSIQVQGKHLYSTFSGIHHDCSPPDTSFVISQAELLIAMKTLLERHYTHIKAEQRSKLANESVLAQEEYVVLQCNGYSNGTVDDEIKYIPNFGTWILPEILGRRDVIIEW